MEAIDRDSEEPVTITLPYNDFCDMLVDIMASHSEFCIMTDKCNCVEREARLAKALDEVFKEE